jgi:hypothetical protein
MGQPDYHEISEKKNKAVKKQRLSEENALTMVDLVSSQVGVCDICLFLSFNHIYSLVLGSRGPGSKEAEQEIAPRP